MQAIKAIETSYKGCRFRSRLEARASLPIQAKQVVNPGGRRVWAWEWDDGRYGD